MRKPDVQRAKTAYTAILGALTVLVGVLFVFVLADIYYTGGKPMYSYAEAGERVRMLLFPICIWIVVAVLGAFLSAPKKPQRRKVSDRAAYERLRRNLPAGEGEEFLAVRKEIRRYDSVVFGIRCFCAAFCVLAAVMCAVYIFKLDHYEYAEIGLNTVVIRIMKWTMPWIGASLLLCIGVVIFEHFGAKRALVLAKRAVVLGKGHPKELPSAACRAAAKASSTIGSKWSIFGIRVAIALVGVIFVVIGVLNGSARDVLYKAAMICTECIGLG